MNFAPLFETYDWSITTAMDISVAQNRTQYGSDILIACHVTGIAKTDLEPVHMTTARIYILLVDEQQSIDIINGIFAKFNEHLRNNVVIIAHGMTNCSVWQFYHFIDNIYCTKNDTIFVEAFAECVESGNPGILTDLTNHVKSDEKKCPLIVAATEFQPFTYYDELTGFYKGIEYLHLNVNFKLADENSIGFVLCARLSHFFTDE